MDTKKPADTAGFLLRTFGKLCLVAAAFVAGYLSWMVWGTSFVTQHAQDELAITFDEKLANQTPPPAEDPVRIHGAAVARIIIPRMHLNMIVVNGTTTEDLIKGPGLYEESPWPWRSHGRVAIAGHRTTYKAPFWDLNLLQKGDPITLETEHGTFVYEVTDLRTVSPTDVKIADPDATDEPTLILTTCNPRFSAAERLVAFAKRVSAHVPGSVAPNEVVDASA